MSHLRTALLFLALVSAGCSSAVDTRSFTTTDSWYAPSPQSTRDFTEIGRNLFTPVEPQLQSEAQAALSEVSVKRITAEEAARFATKTLPDGKEYVLLRAVVLNEGNGGFIVKVNNDSVCVHHGCLGHRPVPMKRKAIVAVLPILPDKVYVDCSMAE